MRLHGLLSFPLTPFTADDKVDLDGASPNTSNGRSRRSPPRCSSPAAPVSSPRLPRTEYRDVVRTAVRVADGRLPVFAGCWRRPAGRRASSPRPPPSAARTGCCCCRPTWSPATPAGLVRPRALTSPRRPACRSSSTSAPTRCSTRRPRVALLDLPTVVGIKDGRGDVDAMLRLVTAVRASGHPRARDLRLPQRPADRRAVRARRTEAIGVDSYSSAVLCFAPDIATAFYRAVAGGRRQGHRAPCWPSSTCRSSALRDQVPGYAVALVKAGRRACRAGGRARCARRWSTPRPEHVARARGDHRAGPGGAGEVCRGLMHDHAKWCSPRSPSLTRHCSTPPACTSRGRCAPIVELRCDDGLDRPRRDLRRSPAPGAAGEGGADADRAGPVRPQRPAVAGSQPRSARSTCPTGTA